MQEKNLLNFIKTKYMSYIVPLAMIAIGVFLVIKPEMSMIASFIGWVLIAAAVALGIFAFSSKGTQGILIIPIIGAGILLILGLIFVLNAGAISMIAVKIIGLVILVNAVIRIVEIVKAKAVSGLIASDIISLILGIVLVFLTGTAAKTVMIILGIVLVITGVTNIVSAYKIYKVGKFVEGEGDIVWEQE